MRDKHDNQQMRHIMVQWLLDGMLIKGRGVARAAINDGGTNKNQNKCILVMGAQFLELLTLFCNDVLGDYH